MKLIYNPWVKGVEGIGIEKCIKNVLQYSNDSSDAISLMGFLYLNQLH